MRHLFFSLVVGAAAMTPVAARPDQAPFGSADIPISHRDRVYAAEQFSNTVSVTDPADNKLLGVIRLGDSLPANFSPLTEDSCSCMAWASHRIIAPSQSSRSDRTQ
jgi:hypothetical protein